MDRDTFPRARRLGIVSPPIATQPWSPRCLCAAATRGIVCATATAEQSVGRWRAVNPWPYALSASPPVHFLNRERPYPWYSSLSWYHPPRRPSKCNMPDRQWYEATTRGTFLFLPNRDMRGPGDWRPRAGSWAQCEAYLRLPQYLFESVSYACQSWLVVVSWNNLQTFDKSRMTSANEQLQRTASARMLPNGASVFCDHTADVEVQY